MSAVLRVPRVLPDMPVLIFGWQRKWLPARVGQGMAGAGPKAPRLYAALFTAALASSGWLTPPGCSFHTDPSGTYVKYEAKAIGSGSEGAQTALQESYR